jgi:hypothetical protein
MIEKEILAQMKSLVKASKVLSCYNLKVITFDYQNEEKMENKKIKFIPSFSITTLTPSPLFGPPRPIPS